MRPLCHGWDDPRPGTEWVSGSGQGCWFEKEQNGTRKGSSKAKGSIKDGEWRWIEDHGTHWIWPKHESCQHFPSKKNMAILIIFMPFPFLPPRPCRPSARSSLAMLIAWIVPRQGIKIFQRYVSHWSFHGSEKNVEDGHQSGFICLIFSDISEDDWMTTKKQQQLHATLPWHIRNMEHVETWPDHPFLCIPPLPPWAPGGTTWGDSPQRGGYGPGGDEAKAKLAGRALGRGTSKIGLEPVIIPEMGWFTKNGLDHPHPRIGRENPREKPRLVFLKLTLLFCRFYRETQATDGQSPRHGPAQRCFLRASGHRQVPNGAASGRMLRYGLGVPREKHGG